MSNRTLTIRGICGALVVALLAACNGGNPGGMLPGSSPSANRTTADRGKPRAHARLTIRIPRRHKHARFVSPNTQSLTIAANGSILGTFNTTPTSNGCASNDGSTQCSFTLGVPAGTVTFAVNTYSAINAGGSILSSGSVTQTIAAGSLAVIPLTLQGVVSSIKVALSNANLPAGTQASTHVYVTAFDPSGAAIVGPGNYNAAITLTDSDSSGITSLSSTPIVAPGGGATLSYNGHSIGSATIGATATGVASTSVTAAVFAPTPTVVANYVLPLGTAGKSQSPMAITTGPDGNIWFSAYSNPYEIVKLTTSGTMTPYSSGLPSARITGLAPGSDGNVWYVDAGSVGEITPSGNVTDHPLTGGGICGAPTGMRIVPGTAADGGLWVSVECSNATTPGQLLHVSTSGAFVASTLPALLRTKTPRSMPTDWYSVRTGTST